MRTVLAGKTDSASVRTTAAQFRTLALLIEQIANCREVTDRSTPCWLDDPESPPRFRSWVPLRHLEAATRSINAFRSEVTEVRSQLQARDADYVQLTSLAFGLPPPKHRS